jgi:NCS1 family nucleobase:cation symporter-1
MVADYYVTRRRRLNVPDLYQSNGQYRYWNGFNWAGIAAWIVAGSVAAC